MRDRIVFLRGSYLTLVKVKEHVEIGQIGLENNNCCSLSSDCSRPELSLSKMQEWKLLNLV